MVPSVQKIFGDFFRGEPAADPIGRRGGGLRANQRLER